LKSNKVESIEALSSLQELEELDLSFNKIRSIIGIEDNLKHLQKLDLSGNLLDDAEEIGVLFYLPVLSDLCLKNNPISPMNGPDSHGYRVTVLNHLPNLSILDGFAVTPEEKVGAKNQWDPPPEVIAASHHADVLKKQIKHYAKIRAVDLMQSSRLRPIVLCGPNGVGKRTLTNRLLKDYPHIFGLSVSHTTRKPRVGEENGIHYYFVSKSEMEQGIEEGRFVESITLFGHMYGTAFKSIDRVTEEGKICVMDLEIEVSALNSNSRVQSL
jgi:hypothetical protein